MDLAITSAPVQVPITATRDDFTDVRPGARWECVMCGRCCGNNFTSTWLDHCVVPITGPLVDGHCIFFDRLSRRCGIYGSRPAVCRGHPFALVKEGGSHRLKVHRHCPGIGQGPVLDRKALLRSILDRVTDMYDMDFIVDWSTIEGDDIVIHRIR